MYMYTGTCCTHFTTSVCSIYRFWVKLSKHPKETCERSMCVYTCTYNITQYGSTVYIGIAMGGLAL